MRKIYLIPLLLVLSACGSINLCFTETPVWIQEFHENYTKNFVEGQDGGQVKLIAVPCEGESSVPVMHTGDKFNINVVSNNDQTCKIGNTEYSCLKGEHCKPTEVGGLLVAACYKNGEVEP